MRGKKIDGSACVLRDGNYVVIDESGTRSMPVWFSYSGGTGEIDGYKFDLAAGVHCQLAITFEKDGEPDFDNGRFYIDPIDLAEAALQEYLKRLEEDPDEQPE